MGNGLKISRGSKVAVISIAIFLLSLIFAGPLSVYGATPSFSISGAKYPVTIDQGSSFSIAGTVKSANKISTITIGVMDSTGNWVKSAFYSSSPMTTSFDVKKADASLKFGSLPAGKYSYRIWTRDTTKASRYILIKDFTVKSKSSGESSFTLKNATYPTAIRKGNNYTVGGVITSNYKLSSVIIGVVDSKGNWVSAAKYSASPLKKAFDIKYADPSIKFAKLSPGQYSYRIWVRDTNGKSKYLLQKSFTVKNQAAPVPTGASSFSISGAKYPVELGTGKGFNISGTVKSNYKISSIIVGVVDSKGNWVSTAKYASSPLTTSFNLVNADSSLKFSSLPQGTYTYKVWVRDTKKQSKYVLEKKFTVGLSPAVMTDKEFDAYLTKQGFPASYKPSLKKLHKAHPTWTFTAQKTGLDWNTVLTKEKEIGRNLVEPTMPAAYKSTSSKVYNSSTKTYKVFDGRWNQASGKAIAYYLDPRNFLTEGGIYQFMDHKRYAASGGKDTIRQLVSNNNCFMNTTSYINIIYDASVTSGVNPNVLTAMVIQEQGWRGGSSIISGKHSKYPGIYNYMNVGAYSADGMNAVTHGLWYAKGSGKGETSYYRPWTNAYKSMTGGAVIYANNYMRKNQNTYYTKKFNVMNGASAVGTHQYMSNLKGASDEANIVKLAYTSNDKGLAFRIPVYNNMPSSVSPKP